jgi:hypothetical protein
MTARAARILAAGSSRPRTAIGAAGLAVAVEARALFGLRADGCVLAASDEDEWKN